MSDVNVRHTLNVNGEDIDVLAMDNSSFLASNKKTTADYRALFAQAIGTTGTIPKIVKMAFGTGGEVDEQGNPTPPSDNGPLNNVVLTKAITAVTYPVDTTVQFTAEILAGDVTAIINEIALIDDGIWRVIEDNLTKMRLLTPKGVDDESGFISNWSVEF